MNAENNDKSQIVAENQLELHTTEGNGQIPLESSIQVINALMIPVRKELQAFAVTKAEWKRLVDEVEGITPPPTWMKDLAFIFFGVFISILLGYYTDVITVSSDIRFIYIVVAVCALILTGICFGAHTVIGRYTKTSKQRLLHEMKQKLN